MNLARFTLKNDVVVITGGAGLLGVKHGEAIAEIGGIPVIVDMDNDRAKEAVKLLNQAYNCDAKAYSVDITDEKGLTETHEKIKRDYGRSPYGLINNATIDPKFDKNSEKIPKSRLEAFPLEQWKKELDVGLTGAFLCSKIFGTEMAKEGRGAILNISSDLGIIAPDQRIYRKEGLPDELQNVKPVTYSVIKHGLIGLTKYLATYWAKDGVRCNAFAPGGVFNDHPEDFVQRLTHLIPLGRMANKDEYKSAIQFLISDASSYMTGAVLIMDGGRSVW